MTKERGTRDAGVLIRDIVPRSIAARLGMRSGTKIISINDQPVRDALDIIFLETGTRLTIKSIDPEKNEKIWTIRKNKDTDLGVVTESIPCNRCRNRCVFCFVDQNPNGLREALYFKDEDYRYSFLCGHYVTLAHIKENDIQRIITQRISPLYISIHATEERIRRHLLGVKTSTPVLPLIQRFATNNIIMHGQIVICPGLNDGNELKRTIKDLLPFWPVVKSVALIPVGLTRFRSQLYRLESGTKEWARSIIRIRDSLKPAVDPGWLACADEFYIKAGCKFPSFSEYGDFDQIANGIGLIRDFITRARRIRKKRRCRFHGGKRAFIITGKSAGFVLREAVAFWTRMDSQAEVQIVEIDNRLFGDTVTVSGLIAGKDILSVFQNEWKPGEADTVYIPSVSIKTGSEVLIDDVSVSMLSRKLKTHVSVIDSDPETLYEELFEESNSN